VDAEQAVEDSPVMTQTLSPRRVTVGAPSGPDEHGHRSGTALAFTALFLGYPLWWLLGVAAGLPLIVAGVMGLDLSRRRSIAVPPGWMLWMLFLAWMGLGVLLLGSDAPGAVPGGLDATRLLVFVYRVAWYVACTVVLLWVLGTPSKILSFRRISSSFAALFVVTTCGGVAGILFATVDFPSALEALLPSSLARNGFVQELVHPGLADVQQVLGRDEARPKAPFPFTNTWGSCMALTLPFFILSWFRYGKPWQRWAAPVVLVTSAVPVAFSLNRGLWICLVAGVLITILVGLARGHKRVLVGGAAMLLVGVVVVVATPLGQLVNERLDNPHSNDRRGNLAVATVQSVAEGSPIVGFGTTRDVQGNFFSLAGGSTPNCPACGSPPLGTQGQLWLVVFSQGLVGLGIFVAFFAVILSRTWRCRTELELTATVILVFFAIQLFVYDTLGLPLFIVMITVAAVCREQRESGIERAQRTLAQSFDRLRSAWLPLATLMLVGALGGVLLSTTRPVNYAAEVDILLSHTPMYLPAIALPRGNPQNDATIDTAAAAVTNDRTLTRVADLVPGLPGADSMRRRILVTAAPNSRVLEVKVFGDGSRQASTAASALARVFLDDRRADLERRRAEALAVSSPDGYLYRAALQNDTLPGTVLRTVPAERIPPDVVKYGVAGLGTGLLLGFTLVCLRPNLTRWRRRTRRHG
jgi:hypothetical protein